MSLRTFYTVDRKTWGAAPPTIKFALKRPAVFVRTIVLSEEKKCWNEDECSEQLRDLQRRDMANGLTDIRPNFLIADDGRVYEGRGWFNTPPDHSMPLFNKYLFEIAHLGGAPDEEFRTEIVKLKMQLIEYGMKNKYIAKFHSIVH